MESLIYVLIHLYLGSVPWQYVEVKRDDNFVNIMNYKRTTSSQVLSLGMPNGFVKIVDYIRNLKFVDTPDYDHLKWWFKEIAQEYAIDLDEQFWWQDDYRKRTSRSRLKSKSSKNLQANLLHQNPAGNEDKIRRNNSLSKKRVVCDMVKPLAKSRWFRVCTNSESVVGCRLFKWTSAYIKHQPSNAGEEERHGTDKDVQHDKRNFLKIDRYIISNSWDLNYYVMRALKLSPFLFTYKKVFNFKLIKEFL